MEWVGQALGLERRRILPTETVLAPVAEKRRRGRPRKPAPLFLHMRVERDEKVSWQSAAKDRGQTLSELVRTTLRNELSGAAPSGDPPGEAGLQTP